MKEIKSNRDLRWAAFLILAHVIWWVVNTAGLIGGICYLVDLIKR